jgi:hypothetical protein
MKIKVLLLLAAGPLAIAAATVGTASAALCKAGGTKGALCRETSATELELVTLGSFLILEEEASERTFRVLTSTNVVITCLTAEGKFEFEGEAIKDESIKKKISPSRNAKSTRRRRACSVVARS